MNGPNTGARRGVCRVYVLASALANDTGTDVQVGPFSSITFSGGGSDSEYQRHTPTRSMCWTPAALCSRAHTPNWPASPGCFKSSSAGKWSSRLLRQAERRTGTAISGPDFQPSASQLLPGTQLGWNTIYGPAKLSTKVPGTLIEDRPVTYYTDERPPRPGCPVVLAGAPLGLTRQLTKNFSSSRSRRLAVRRGGAQEGLCPSGTAV